jgi:hypothetical protein
VHAVQVVFRSVAPCMHMLFCRLSAVSDSCICDVQLGDGYINIGEVLAGDRAQRVGPQIVRHPDASAYDFSVSVTNPGGHVAQARVGEFREWLENDPSIVRAYVAVEVGAQEQHRHLQCYVSVP